MHSLTALTTLALAAARWGSARRDLLALQAFRSGMAPIVIGLLIATGWILSAQTPGWAHVCLTVASAIIVWRTRIHLLWMVAFGGFVGAMGWL